MNSIRRFVYFCLALILLFVCLYFAPAKAQTEDTAPDFAAIDAFVEDQMKANGIRGAAIAIVQGDQIVHMRGFGVAGPSGTAVTPQTPFFAGSVSKPVTGMSVRLISTIGAVVMLLLTALLARSFVRLRLWRRRLEERPLGLWPAFRIIILPIIGDLILPAAALVFTAGNPFPRKIDMWITLGLIQPDLIYWLLFVVIALFVKAIIRLSIVLITLQKPQAVIDTATVAHGH